MAMERRNQSYDGGTYGGGYGGAYEEPYQMKRYKSTSKPKVFGMGMQDPEMKRKKRVASYKVYTVEGKVKASEAIAIYGTRIPGFLEGAAEQ